VPDTFVHFCLIWLPDAQFQNSQLFDILFVLDLVEKDAGNLLKSAHDCPDCSAKCETE